MKPVWIYGVHSVKALIEARPGAVREVRVVLETRGPRWEIAAQAEAWGIPVRPVRTSELTSCCQSNSHQGVAAHAPLPPERNLDDIIARPPFLLAALDGITDPQNLGAIARTAEALGASGLILPRDRAAALSPAAHKASAGALEFLPAAVVVNLARALRQLKEAGYWNYGADPSAPQDLSSLKPSNKAVIVLGAEGRGIRPGVAKELDFRLRIPLAGKTESLNVSAAFAIILFWYQTQASSSRSGQQL